MRRKDREMKNQEEILEVMKRCQVCRLALFDDPYPYVVPLNFGMKAEKDSVTLYFHGAKEGKKYELMRKNKKAAFEMDCTYGIDADVEKGECTQEYESVMGCGTLEFLEGAEKEEGLRLLLNQYPLPEGFAYDMRAAAATCVFCLRVDSMTGKKRRRIS